MIEVGKAALTGSKRRRYCSTFGVWISIVSRQQWPRETVHVRGVLGTRTLARAWSTRTARPQQKILLMPGQPATEVYSHGAAVSWPARSLGSPVERRRKDPLPISIILYASLLHRWDAFFPPTLRRAVRGYTTGSVGHEGAWRHAESFQQGVTEGCWRRGRLRAPDENVAAQATWSLGPS